MLKKQIETHRLYHVKAGTLIAIVGIFIPTFLFIFEEGHPYIQYASLIPLVILAIAIYMMLRIFHSKPLDHGINVSKFEDMADMDYKNSLAFEIGANRKSFKNNLPVLEALNKKFNCGLKITVLAILLMFFLLICNTFVKTEFPMADNDKKVEKVDGKPETKVAKTPISIPDVDKKDLTQLNEGDTSKKRK